MPYCCKDVIFSYKKVLTSQHLCDNWRLTGWRLENWDRLKLTQTDLAILVGLKVWVKCSDGPDLQSNVKLQLMTSPTACLPPIPLTNCDFDPVSTKHAAALLIRLGFAPLSDRKVTLWADQV